MWRRSALSRFSSRLSLSSSSSFPNPILIPWSRELYAVNSFSQPPISPQSSPKPAISGELRLLHNDVAKISSVSLLLEALSLSSSSSFPNPILIPWSRELYAVNSFSQPPISPQSSPKPAISGEVPSRIAAAAG
ncbi:hypothetical protein F2Q69_00010649 [Brassica cretica]|uniref:Uncharacterized protein n=1 Tax=Brassica cretica TaxID=69181 RepID=A0A8S9QZ26_BRACR|nr:hypothetical protein F2Q69_00010649 [Brassica cretica]